MSKRSPRLLFTDEELAAPELKKAIRKADKRMKKLEKAEAKIPKKTVKKKQRVVDPKTGTVTTRLSFEEVDKKRPPSKLTHALRDAPGAAALSAVHREIQEHEQDNVGVESAHGVEQAAERAVRLASTPTAPTRRSPTAAQTAPRPRQTAPTSVRWTKRHSAMTRSFPAIPTHAGSRSRPSSGSTPPPKPEKAPGIRSKPPKPRQRRRGKPRRTQRKPVSSSPVTKRAFSSWAASRQ